MTAKAGKGRDTKGHLLANASHLGGEGVPLVLGTAQFLLAETVLQIVRYFASLDPTC